MAVFRLTYLLAWTAFAYIHATITNSESVGGLGKLWRKIRK